MNSGDESTVDSDAEHARMQQCFAELNQADESQRNAVLRRYYPHDDRQRALASFLGHPLAVDWEQDFDELDDALAASNASALSLSHAGSRLDRTRGRAWRNRIAARGLACAAVLLTVAGVMVLNRPSARFTLTFQPSMATVHLNGDELLSVDGRFSNAVLAGSRRLRVQASGYKLHEEMLEFRRGEELTHDVRLIPLIGRLEITSDPKDAAVEVIDVHGETVASGRSPLRTSELASGEVTIRTTLPLFVDVMRVATVPNDHAISIVPPIRLTPATAPELGSPYWVYWTFSMEDRFAESVRADNATLSQIAQRVSDQCGRPVFIDWDQVQSLGHHPEQVWSMVMRSMNEFVAELRRVGLGLTMTNEDSLPQWMITSHDAAQAKQLSGLYSLKSLRVQLDATEACRMLSNNIQPVSWETSGGPNTIAPLVDLDAVAVAANLATHVAIARYLKNLSQVSIRDSEIAAVDELWGDGLVAGQVRVIDDSFGLSIEKKPIHLLAHELAGHALLFLDNRRLVSGSDDATLRMWDTDDGTELMQFETGDRRVLCLAALPSDVNRFISGDGRGNLRLYDAEQTKAINREHRHEGDVTSLSVDSSGDWLISGGSDGFVVRFELPQLKYRSFGRLYLHNLNFVNYDSQRTIMAGMGEPVVWALDSESLVPGMSVKTRELVPQMIVVEVPNAGGQQSRLIIAGQRLSSWHLSDQRFESVAVAGDPPSVVQSIAKFNHHNLFATVHQDGRLLIRNALTLGEVATIRLPLSQSRAGVAIASDDSKLAVFNWFRQGDSWQAAIYVYQFNWAD